ISSPTRPNIRHRLPSRSGTPGRARSAGCTGDRPILIQGPTNRHQPNVFRLSRGADTRLRAPRLVGTGVAGRRTHGILDGVHRQARFFYYGEGSPAAVGPA